MSTVGRLAGFTPTVISGWKLSCAGAAARHRPPGATAAQALLGRDFRVTKRRGEIVSGDIGKVIATYHPAAVLTLRDADRQQQMRQELIDDLRIAVGVMDEG